MAFSFSIRSLGMCLFSFHWQTGEFQSKFHSKNRYRTHRFVIHAISVLSVKFTMVNEAMNFSIEESKENDLIIIKSSYWKHQNADNLKPFIFTNPTGSTNK